jgi:hypothetical protein
MDSRFFEGPAGRLDARVDGPAAGPPVVVLHPHPRFGGTMGSRFVHDAASGLAGAGWRVVRFAFRGVGRSAGAYGGGVGEAEDAAAVVDAVRAEAGRAPAVVGYSFGGAVACRLAAMRPLAGLVLVATPVRLAECVLAPLDDAPRAGCRATIVVGGRDGFVPVADARRLAAAFPVPARLVVLPDAGHFLEPSHNRDGVAAVVAALGPI